MFYVVTYAGSGLVTVGVGPARHAVWAGRVGPVVRGGTSGRVPAHARRAAPVAGLVHQQPDTLTYSDYFMIYGKSLRHFELQPFDIRLTPEIIAKTIDL